MLNTGHSGIPTHQSEADIDFPQIPQLPFAKPEAELASVSRPVLIDLAKAASSAHACQMLEDFIHTASINRGRLIELNVGALLLSRGILANMNLKLKKKALKLNTVYSTTPQTQQAALDEGFFVREAPQRVEMLGQVQLTQSPVSSPASIHETYLHSQSASASAGIDLPRFERSQAPVSETVVSAEKQEAKPEPVSGNTPFTRLPEQPEFVFGAIPETPPPVASVSASSQQVDTEQDAPKVLTAADEIEASFKKLSQSSVSSGSQSTSVDTELDSDRLPTLFVKNTLRSGQVLRYQGNIVVIGDVHAGSEITAAGDILVWGELKGIAHAGSDGDFRASIRAMKIEALQLRIADYIARRPDRIYYHKNQASQLPSPELAKVSDGEIRIFKEDLGS